MFSFFVLLVPFVGSLRISWEPAFLHSLFLCKEFADAPERWEGEGAKDGIEDDVLNKEKSHQYGNDAGNEEYPPIASAAVVFHFDDDGMKDADDEKSGNAYE